MPLKHINAELAKRGYTARLERRKGYFHFIDGEATGWVFATVRVPKIDNLTVTEWVEEFERLRKLNAEIVRVGARTGKL